MSPSPWVGLGGLRIETSLLFFSGGILDSDGDVYLVMELLISVAPILAGIGMISPQVRSGK